MLTLDALDGVLADGSMTGAPKADVPSDELTDGTGALFDGLEYADEEED